MTTCVHSYGGANQNTFYLVEPGLRAWESVQSAATGTDKATLTVVAASAVGLARLLRLMFGTLSDRFHAFIAWHTGGVSFSGSKSRARIMIKELERRQPGFGDRHLEFDDSGSVVCIASMLELPFREDHLSVLSYSQYELLILTKGTHVTPESVCSDNHRLAGPLDQKRLLEIAEALGDDVLARYYEDRCTHGAWQFMGPREEIEMMEAFLMQAAVRKVEVKDVPQEIVAFEKPGDMA